MLQWIYARWAAQDGPRAKRRRLENFGSKSSQQLASKLVGASKIVPAIASVWDLVYRTASHPQYHEQYKDMPSWERGWKRPQRCALRKAGCSQVALNHTTATLNGQ